LKGFFSNRRNQRHTKIYWNSSMLNRTLIAEAAEVGKGLGSYSLQTDIDKSKSGAIPGQ